MVASSKGYLLPDYLLATCVHIIAEVSESPYMDCLAARESDSTPQTHADCPEDRLDAPSIATPSTETPSHSPSLINENHQSKKKFKMSSYDVRQQPASATRTLVLSIMLRTAFGGMACDVVMLKKYTSLWYNRFFPDRGDADRVTPSAFLTPVSSDVTMFFLSPSCDESSDNIASEMTSNPLSTPIPLSTSACQQLAVLLPAAGHELSLSLHLQRDMTVYMHHRWTDSDLSGKSLWVKRCVESFSSLPIKISAADSDIDCSAAAAGSELPLPEVLESLTFSTLRRYISNSLRDGGCTPLSLYAPDQAALAAPGAASPALRKLLQQHLLLRTLDLIPEGIDFHCDSEIIRAVRDRYYSRSVQLFYVVGCS
jgi:hypothetical protein